MDVIKYVMERSFLGNTVAAYGAAVGIFAAGWLLIIFLRRIGFTFLEKFTKKTSSEMDDSILKLIETRAVPLLYCAAFYMATQQLVLGATAAKVVTIGVAALATFFAVRMTLSVVYLAIDHWWRMKGSPESSNKILKGVFAGIQVAVWCTGLVLLLDNLGMKISTLVAGLGIGGVAVALASQAVLADFFSYFTVFIDRPFEVGDFIIVDGHLGTVEAIGIKSTRIQSLSGEQIVFCNSDLVKSRIRNFKRMQRRRVLFTFGIVYSTPAETIRKIPETLTSIIRGIPDALFDRAHFKEFGPSSLDFEVVYYVLSGDYNKYMDIQQVINCRIKEEFDKEGIEFAFPTHTVYMAGEMGKCAADAAAAAFRETTP